jgi:chromosome segregation ATPase
MELEALKSLYEKESKKVEDLSARLHEKESKEMDFARTLTLLTQNVDALSMSNSQLKEDMVVSENKLRDDFAKKLSNEIERHREELKQVHEQYEVDLLHKDEEITELESTIAFRNDEKDSLVVSLSDAKEDNERLSKEIEKVKKEALKTPLQGIVAAIEGMKIRKDRQALLHFATYPIELVLGKKDGVLNYDENIEQIEGTKVQLTTFPDGHMSHIENEKELKQVLENFLKKV